MWWTAPTKSSSACWTKREFKAKVVGADERSDVALLKIDADKLPTVKLAEPGRCVRASG